MKRTLVTLGTEPYYSVGVKRMYESVIKNDPTIEFASWSKTYPTNSPTHQELPYAFKTFAMLEARKNGSELAVWLDSPGVVLRKLDPLYDLIARQGYYFVANGWSVGQWSSDLCLEYFSISREKAFEIPQVAGGFWGLDFRTELASSFMDEIQSHVKAKTPFFGDWVNTQGQISEDKRVLGHRHDQIIMSIMVYRMGLTTVPEGNSFITTATEPPEDKLLAWRNI